MDTRKVNFSLECGVYGFSKITAADITRSFQVTGIFSFDGEFSNQFRARVDEAREESIKMRTTIQKSTPGKIQNVRRETHEETL